MEELRRLIQEYLEEHICGLDGTEAEDIMDIVFGEDL